MTEYIGREQAKMAFLNIDAGRGGGTGETTLTLEAVADILDEIDAADVVPVKHGRWDGDTCTACKLPWKYNMVQDADDWGYFDPMPDYCPNCGAKMDGGIDDAVD